MTDNEIIKALECCSGNGGCRECPYDDKECGFEQDAIALIKRLQAERDYWMAQYTKKCEPLSAAAVAEQTLREHIRLEHLRRMEEQIGRLTMERNEARFKRDMAIIDRREIIANFKKTLLKKIFPFDAVDKKQYSINAYAVERAIIEVAEQMSGGKYESN